MQMTHTRNTFWLVLTLLVTTPAAEAGANEPVFPGAEGFGVQTQAGKGGRIFYVTSLADKGPGTFREAVEHSLPRQIVFEVSGRIALKSPLNIRSPYISIYGQTAPPPGVTLTGHTIFIQTHDVLIQHVRIRIGDDQVVNKMEADTIDAITVVAHPRVRALYPDSIGTYNVVIDHVSTSWTIDEAVSCFRVSDVTFSNCIFAEALDASKYVPEPHSMGPFTGWSKRLAFGCNLTAHIASRNFKFGGDTEVVCWNNVVYNSRWIGIEVENMDKREPPVASIIANVVRRGPDSGNGTRYPVWVNRVTENTRVYVDGHQCDFYNGDPWSCVNQDSTAASARVDEPPIMFDPITIRPQDQVLDWVLENAGAWPAMRDPVDKRIISEVRSKTGKIIDSPTDVGGWHEMAENKRRLDPPKDPDAFAAWLSTYTEAVEKGE